MYSSPSYDPNLFLFGISQDDWQLIRNNPLKPLINKTLSGLYSPGSTIKPIVALSALENKLLVQILKLNVQVKQNLWTNISLLERKRTWFVSLKNAMKQSCDTYFYEIARKLGVDRLKVTAEKFGLGEKVLGEYFENEKKDNFQIQNGKKIILEKVGFRRNINNWYWSRIYSNYTITTYV